MASLGFIGLRGLKGLQTEDHGANATAPLSILIKLCGYYSTLVTLHGKSALFALSIFHILLCFHQSWPIFQSNLLLIEILCLPPTAIPTKNDFRNSGKLSIQLFNSNARIIAQYTVDTCFSIILSEGPMVPDHSR